MKILKYIAIPLLLVALIFSCSKRYEDDPITMKFVSLKKRIEGEWHIEKILIDEQDYTYIIDVDSLQIFSIYEFKTFSKSYTDGGLNVRTKNGSFRLDERLKYNLHDYDKLEKISFFRKSPFDSLKNVNTFGPINYYLTADTISSNTYTWEIRKLTKKEFYIITYYQSKQYELFFIKN